MQVINNTYCPKCKKKFKLSHISCEREWNNKRCISCMSCLIPLEGFGYYPYVQQEYKAISFLDINEIFINENN